MKIPSCYNRANSQQDSAMTPMIDVVFLLLIFFVCASAVPVAETIISSPLKKMETEKKSSPVAIDEKKLAKIVIRKLNNGPVTYKISLEQEDSHQFAQWNVFQKYLSEHQKELHGKPVVLDIGSDVTMKTALEVYDLCQQNSFQDVSFGVRSQSRRERDR
jgi:biopolymer transport protein ExbD